MTASKTAILLGIHRNTMNRYFNLFRLKIAPSSFEGGLFSGDLECDESYFWAFHGPRCGRKNPRFWVLETRENVYEMAQNCSKNEMMPSPRQNLRGAPMDGELIKGRFEGSDHPHISSGKIMGRVQIFRSFPKRYLAKFEGLTDKFFETHDRLDPIFNVSRLS